MKLSITKFQSHSCLLSIPSKNYILEIWNRDWPFSVEIFFNLAQSKKSQVVKLQELGGLLRTSLREITWYGKCSLK